MTAAGGSRVAQCLGATNKHFVVFATLLLLVASLCGAAGENLFILVGNYSASLNVPTHLKVNECEKKHQIIT